MPGCYACITSDSVLRYSCTYGTIYILTDFFVVWLECVTYVWKNSGKVVVHPVGHLLPMGSVFFY